MSSGLKNKIFKNSVYNNSSYFIGKVAAIIFTMVLARLMNPQMFGTYFFALSIASITIALTDLGIGGTMQRYVANSIGKDDKTLARSYIRYLFRIKMPLALGGSFLLFISSGYLAASVFGKPELTMPLQISSVFMFFQSISDFEIYLFSALQDFKYKFIRSITFQLFRFIFIPLALIYGFGVNGALWGTAFTVIMVVVILLFFIFRKYSDLIIGRVVPVPRKRLLKFVSYATVFSVSALIYLWIDTLMVGAFLPIEYVGYYRAAGTIISGLIGLVALNQVLLPVFSQETGERLKKLYKEAFRYMAIVSFPMTFGIIMVAEPLIKVIYTDAYMPAAAPLFIMAFLIIEAITGFLIPTIFIANEKPQYPAYSFLASMFINIALNFYLIPLYGMVGAAGATVISRFTNSAILSIELKRKLNIAPDLSSVTKPLIASLLMAAFLSAIPKAHNILSGAFIIIIGAGFYIGVMILIKGIKKKDMDSAKNIVSSIVNRL